MADDFFSRTPGLASGAAPARRIGKGTVLTVMLAFVLGAGVIGYLAWAGLLPHRMTSPDRLLVDGGAPGQTPTVKDVLPVLFQAPS